jgi:hypothetical protein
MDDPPAGFETPSQHRQPATCARLHDIVAETVCASGLGANGGPNGLRCHARTTATGVVLVGLPQLRKTAGVSGRAPSARPRARHLSEDERSTICSLADTKRLRSLAADLGVSHEPVRAAIRDAEAKVG